MNRKSFLRIAGVGVVLTLAGNKLIGQSGAQQGPVQQNAGKQDPPPPLPIPLVKEFVIAGHGNFPKVQAMLLETPNLIYSKFDWGNGDFEAAIEGAGHVGNKEIANYLLQAGSRVTIYILTMLGKTDLVKPILEKYPSLITAKGPHGFTLLHHAKVGGKDAEELYSYLQEKGMKDDWVKLR